VVAIIKIFLSNTLLFVYQTYGSKKESSKEACKEACSKEEDSCKEEAQESLVSLCVKKKNDIAPTISFFFLCYGKDFLCYNF